jgi:uncharacterized membrane protein (Fun14 family)
MEPAEQSVVTWYDALQHALARYPGWVIDMGVLGGMGLILGFVIKKMGRFIWGALIIGLVFILLAHYVKSDMVNSMLLKEFFVIPTLSVEDIFNRIIVVASAHIGATLSFIFGFFVGWCIG